MIPKRLASSVPSLNQSPGSPAKRYQGESYSDYVTPSRPSVGPLRPSPLSTVSPSVSTPTSTVVWSPNTQDPKLSSLGKTLLLRLAGLKHQKGLCFPCLALGRRGQCVTGTCEVERWAVEAFSSEDPPRDITAAVNQFGHVFRERLMAISHCPKCYLPNDATGTAFHPIALNKRCITFPMAIAKALIVASVIWTSVGTSNQVTTDIKARWFVQMEKTAGPLPGRTLHAFHQMLL
jgi:hypothetical protein